MESNRIWHEPVVEIYANAITPGVCCAAYAYDLANRRWYILNVRDSTVPDANWRHDTRLDIVPEDDWLSSTVEKHVKASYDLKSSPPLWNTINTNSSGNPVSLDLSDEASIRRRISMKFTYGNQPFDILPTTTFDQLREKTYLSRGADYCLWNGRRCVFKRIEFDGDVESHKNEIRARETIIRYIERHSGSSKDHNQEMESRFNVVPILAVVLHDETSIWITADEHSQAKDSLIAGILTPWEGCSLDRFNPNSVTGSPSTMDIPVSEEQLLDLACGIRNLSKCGLTHGDICYWNTILTQPRPTDSRAARLLLIDMGDVAPEYEGDINALGDLFLWCLQHSSRLSDSANTKRRILTAAALLKTGNLNAAIEVLSSSNARSGFKTSLSDSDREVKRKRI